MSYKLNPQWLKPVILATWEAEISEDQGLRPAWGNSSQDPIFKITRAKWTGRVALAVACLFASKLQSQHVHTHKITCDFLL
jgi:hypothetical protein